MRKLRCSWTIGFEVDNNGNPIEPIWCGVVIQDSSKSYCPKHEIKE